MSEKIIAIVNSPSSNKHLREASGFSLGEIKKAGKSVKMLKNLGIQIDYRRSTIHESNVQKIKSIKPIERKTSKKEPFVPKEKKKRVRKPKKEIAKEIEPKKEEAKVEKKKKGKSTKKKEAKQEKPSKIKKEKKEIIPEEVVEKEISKEISEGEIIPLANLSGCGPATAKKLAEIGISSVQDLVEEDPEEIGLLIKGVSVERIKEWIAEGKNLLEK